MIKEPFEMMEFSGIGYGEFDVGNFGWSFHILIFVGVVYLIYYLVRSSSRQAYSGQISMPTKEIAAQCFARGEV